MPKSLAQAAREILNENENAASLKPGSKHKEPMPTLPKDKVPETEDKTDAGEPIVQVDNQNDIAGKLTNDVSKDSSKSAAKSGGEQFGVGKGNVPPKAGKQTQHQSPSSDGEKFGLGGKLNPAGIAEEQIEEVLNAIVESMVEDGLSEEEINEHLDNLTEEDFMNILEEIQNEEDTIEEEITVEEAVDMLAEEGLSEEEIFEEIASQMDEEQLDELSKDTLKSYINKSVNKKPGDLAGSWKKRRKGLNTASSKLLKKGGVNEEEEIQEEETPEITVDMQEHLDALFNGETLSEEFKAKAKTIFETAVINKIKEEMVKLEEVFAQSFEESVEEAKEELAEGVEDYLNYVTEQWVSENEVAIEAGLRTELTEDFISGLRTLFAEHYIDIPEEKVSVVEELTAKNAELEQKLNEEIQSNVELSKAISEYAKHEIVSELTEELTDTQAAKVLELAEDVDFDNIESFTEKVKLIRENYFPAKGVKTTDIEEVDAETGALISESEVPPNMEAYLRTLGKTFRK